MNPVTRETSRLLLEGLSPENMKYIFDNLPKPEIMEMLGHRSEEDYLKEEYKHKNGYSSYNRSFLLFLLKEKDSGKIIGRCGIHNWNKVDRRAEIGYIMHDEDYKNKGFMSEAAETIIEYGFTVLKLNRIEALVGMLNEPSIRLIEKNNFKMEGILKGYFNTGRKFDHAVLYAKLYNEYIEEKYSKK